MDRRGPRWFPWDPRRFLLAGALIAGMVAVATATAGLLEVREITDRLDRSPRLELGPDVSAAEAGAPQNILVIGSDRRPGNRLPSFSDTLLLVRLDPRRGGSAVMSIPRDLRTTIRAPGRAPYTGRITEAYAAGGPATALRAVREVVGIPIHHVVNVAFSGFRAVVDRVGCVYVDVDRRYFNDNAGPGEPYEQIDLRPGYQRLCGEDALDFVRYRHDDSDAVRRARQLEFLRQTREQVGVRRVVYDRRALATILGRHAQTDIRSTREVLRIVKLVIFAVRRPLREVTFPGRPGGDDDPSWHATPAQVRSAVRRFLTGRESRGVRGTLQSTPRDRRSAARLPAGRTRPAGLEDAPAAALRPAAALAGRLPFPVLAPAVQTRRAAPAGARAYRLSDEEGEAHDAYRLVFKLGSTREYYGVQATDWRDPPALRGPRRGREYAGRKLEVFSARGRPRLVALRTDDAVYWVSNTLLGTLSEQQMLAIAGSLRPAG